VSAPPEIGVVPMVIVFPPYGDNLNQG